MSSYTRAQQDKLYWALSHVAADEIHARTSRVQQADPRRAHLQQLRDIRFQRRPTDPYLKDTHSELTIHDDSEANILGKLYEVSLYCVNKQLFQPPLGQAQCRPTWRSPSGH
jgi:hypothetical protein